METTLWYRFGKRYYDPEIIRWISTDPEVQYFDLYNYSGNDPINKIDPDGSVAIVDDAAIVYGLVAAATWTLGWVYGNTTAGTVKPDKKAELDFYNNTSGNYKARGRSFMKVPNMTPKGWVAIGVFALTIAIWNYETMNIKIGEDKEPQDLDPDKTDDDDDANKADKAKTPDAPKTPDTPTNEPPSGGQTFVLTPDGGDWGSDEDEEG